jgi:hypothetical protein
MFEELTNEQHEVTGALHVKLVDTIMASTQDLDMAIIATCKTLVYLLTTCADAHDRSKVVADAIVEIVDDLVPPVDTTQLPVTDDTENVF